MNIPGTFTNYFTYFWPLTCLIWWNTLMTSLIRLGHSSIFEARFTHAMAKTLNWKKKKKKKKQYEFYTQWFSTSKRNNSSNIKFDTLSSSLGQSGKLLIFSYILVGILGRSSWAESFVYLCWGFTAQSTKQKKKKTKKNQMESCQTSQFT